MIDNSNDLRQLGFRINKEAAGLKRTDLWVTKEDGIISARVGGKLPTMPISILEKSLQQHFEKTELDVVYNELFEYAKRMEKRIKKAVLGG
ncbi:MAG: hypothetical protein FWD14_01825 [Treponema sp.]|nr:hypothetical protein [Treponema sp.]